MKSLKGQRNVVKCNAFKAAEHADGIGSNVFIRMELLTPLVEYLLNNEMDETSIVKFGIDICTALVECQSKGIIHRDIKPENLFVSPRGLFKLGDFGIARVMDHTTYATMIGTYQYIAPEVFKSNKYGKEADIYSFGLVMYWLLNNCRGPFLPIDRPCTYEESERANRRRMGGETIPAPINGSNQLNQIILKACEYNPNNRYQSAKKMLEDLESLYARNDSMKTGLGKSRKAVQTKPPVSKDMIELEKTVRVPRPKSTENRSGESTDRVSNKDNSFDKVRSIKNKHNEQTSKGKDKKEKLIKTYDQLAVEELNASVQNRVLVSHRIVKIIGEGFEYDNKEDAYLLKLGFINNVFSELEIVPWKTSVNSWQVKSEMSVRLFAKERKYGVVLKIKQEDLKTYNISNINTIKIVLRLEEDIGFNFEPIKLEVPNSKKTDTSFEKSGKLLFEGNNIRMYDVGKNNSILQRMV